MLPCFNVRSIPATVSADELIAPNTALLTQISAHCFPPAVGSAHSEPMLQVVGGEVLVCFHRIGRARREGLDQ